MRWAGPGRLVAARCSGISAVYRTSSKSHSGGANTFTGQHIITQAKGVSLAGKSACGNALAHTGISIDRSYQYKQGAIPMIAPYGIGETDEMDEAYDEAYDEN